MANGSLPSAVVIVWWFTGLQVFYMGYLSGVSAAAADTWATEIGTLSNRKPRLTTSFVEVPNGSSGAISLLGFLGSIGGSFSIVVASSPWLRNGNFFQISLIVVSAGIIGSIADSLAGATIQSQYTCEKCSRTTERLTCCDGTTTRSKGWHG